MNIYRTTWHINRTSLCNYKQKPLFYLWVNLMDKSCERSYYCLKHILLKQSLAFKKMGLSRFMAHFLEHLRCTKLTAFITPIPGHLLAYFEMTAFMAKSQHFLDRCSGKLLILGSFLFRVLYEITGLLVVYIAIP